MGHKSKNGENNRCREKWGECINTTNKKGISVAIMVELVIWSQSQESSNANSIWEENLSASIDPALTGWQSAPIRSEQKFDTIPGTFKCQGLDTENAQNNVREDRTAPNDLKKSND